MELLQNAQDALKEEVLLNLIILFQKSVTSVCSQIGWSYAIMARISDDVKGISDILRGTKALVKEANWQIWHWQF